MKGIDFDERFANWLRDEAGILEQRRIARVGGGGILVSKFEEGFAARVHAAIAGLPELFRDTVVGEQYRNAARDLPGETRVACWHEGVRRLLAGAVEAGRLTGEERAEVLAGIDSVAALLDSILWTSPLAAARATSSADWAEVMASGFSHITWRPAAMIAFTCGWWSSLGEVTWTTRTASSASSSARFR